MRLIIGTTLLLTIVLIGIPFARCGLDQKRLLRDLFETRKYNVLERPVKNDSHTLHVSLSFDLQQIITLDEKDQFIESSIWITYAWHDAGLMWNPEDYGQISRIRLAPDAVWRPDVLMYNSANEEFDGTWPVNVIVENTGSVSYIPPAMLRSICKIQIRWFPFDEQYCALKFGSWTYDDRQVNVTLDEGNPIVNKNIVPNGEWSIVQMVARRYDKEFPYGGVMENYPFVTLYFHLQRQPLYYIFNLIMPVALISFMAILVFTLPVDSGEKMALSVTILLSLTVFNMVVAEFVPRTSEALPLLGIYFACTMFMCSVALVTSVWVLNLYYFPHLVDAPPTWIRYGICVYLAQFLRMHIPTELLNSAKERETQKRMLRQLNAHNLVSYPMSNERDLNLPDQHVGLNNENSFPTACSGISSAGTKERLARLDGYPDSIVNQTEQVDTNGKMHSDADFNSNLAVEKLEKSKKTESISGKNKLHDELTCRCCFYLRAMAKELKVLTQKVSGDCRTDLIRIEWRFAARVIDRACLFVFILVNVICTFVVLLNKPAPRSGAEKPPGWPCND